MNDPNRTGAVRPAEVPAEVVAALNQGTLATVNLAEGLAVDFVQLFASVFPERDGTAVRLAAEQGITTRMQAAGVALLDADLNALREHPSDTVRGWACYVIGIQPKWKLARRFQEIEPLADDPHFGVREWAWLALRPHLIASVSHFLDRVQPWALSPRPNLRRFASESTRPRGVWCAQCKPLVQNPALAEKVLEPLRSDPAEYVQLSVGNWLNDAGKSQPQWVNELAERWRRQSPTPATTAILKRALRGLQPNGRRKKEPS
ncbi:MAG: DNA alkylation repair protein [Gemmataceae bacterium]